MSILKHKNRHKNRAKIPAFCPSEEKVAWYTCALDWTNRQTMGFWRRFAGCCLLRQDVERWDIKWESDINKYIYIYTLTIDTMINHTHS
jgi:hypothetical protein